MEIKGGVTPLFLSSSTGRRRGGIRERNVRKGWEDKLGRVRLKKHKVAG